METSGTFVSWISDAAAGFIASLSDPKYWGVILALLILVILYSIVSSINRLGRRIASVSSELSEIRSSLRKLALSLDKGDAGRTPSDREGMDVRDLRFLMDDDRSG